jgi:hypothetical protein
LLGSRFCRGSVQQVAEALQEGRHGRFDDATIPRQKKGHQGTDQCVTKGSDKRVNRENQNSVPQQRVELHISNPRFNRLEGSRHVDAVQDTQGQCRQGHTGHADIHQDGGRSHVVIRLGWLVVARTCSQEPTVPRGSAQLQFMNTRRSRAEEHQFDTAVATQERCKQTLARHAACQRNDMRILHRKDGTGFEIQNRESVDK